DQIEALLVVRKAQAAGELRIRRQLIIGFAEHCPGCESVGILAAKIIVAATADIFQWIWIDIRTTQAKEPLSKDSIAGRLRPTGIGKLCVERDVDRIGRRRVTASIQSSERPKRPIEGFRRQ